MGETERETVGQSIDHLKSAWTHIDCKWRRNIPKYIFRYMLREERTNPMNYYGNQDINLTEAERQSIRRSFREFREKERLRERQASRKDYKRTLNEMLDAPVWLRILTVTLQRIMAQFNQHDYSKINPQNRAIYHQAVCYLLSYLQ
jgi:hypothetical protein